MMKDKGLGADAMSGGLAFNAMTIKKGILYRLQDNQLVGFCDTDAHALEERLKDFRQPRGGALCPRHNRHPPAAVLLEQPHQ